tara:strand:+ start:30 stop:290 length:261 start_codon:yes stop_codon:yes gene_type:complete
MATVGSSNITFNNLKAAYDAGNQSDAAQHSALTDGKTDTTISLSFFRGAGFSNGASDIPTGSASISINSHFKGNTFGSSGGGGKPP